MRRHATAALVVVAFASATPIAFADDILTRAQALENDYVALQAHFDADDLDHATLASSLDALDSRLSQLRADRDALGVNCNCQALDASIAHSVDLSGNMRKTMGTWEDS